MITYLELIDAINVINANLTIKGFKTSGAMHKFLNTGDNSLKWCVSNKGLKAGTYFSQYDVNKVFKYIPTKNLYL